MLVGFHRSHEASVVLIGDDGRPIFAASEERLSRIKMQGGWPRLIADFVSEHYDLAGAQAAHVFGKTSVGIEEPALFSEPGLFLVRPDGTLYWSAVQTMPFSRPHLADLLAALDFIAERNYPARGEVVNLPAQAAE